MIVVKKTFKTKKKNINIIFTIKKKKTLTERRPGIKWKERRKMNGAFQFSKSRMLVVFNYKIIV